MGLDYSKVPPDVLEKIKAREANRPENRSVTILKDVADITQELLNVVDSIKEQGQKGTKELGAVLLDLRESMDSIKNKKDAEMPDYAKPVVASLEKLEKSLTSALNKIDTKPVVNVPKADAPTVNVEAPSIDLSGVEQILKKELPKSFQEAVSKIPQTPAIKLTPLQNLIRDMAEDLGTKLQDIDTAVRIKPQMPTTLKVTNPDGSSIGSLSGGNYESRNDTTTDTNLVYLGKALPGSATSDAAWQIKRYNKSAGTMTFADDVTTLTKVWDNRTGYTY